MNTQSDSLSLSPPSFVGLFLSSMCKWLYSQINVYMCVYVCMCVCIPRCENGNFGELPVVWASFLSSLLPHAGLFLCLFFIMGCPKELPESANLLNNDEGGNQSWNPSSNGNSEGSYSACIVNSDGRHTTTNGGGGGDDDDDAVYGLARSQSSPPVLTKPYHVSMNHVHDDDDDNVEAENRINAIAAHLLHGASFGSSVSSVGSVGSSEGMISYGQKNHQQQQVGEVAVDKQEKEEGSSSSGEDRYHKLIRRASEPRHPSPSPSRPRRTSLRVSSTLRRSNSGAINQQQQQQQPTTPGGGSASSRNSELLGVVISGSSGVSPRSGGNLFVNEDDAFGVIANEIVSAANMDMNADNNNNYAGDDDDNNMTNTANNKDESASRRSRANSNSSYDSLNTGGSFSQNESHHHHRRSLSPFVHELVIDPSLIEVESSSSSSSSNILPPSSSSNNNHEDDEEGVAGVTSSDVLSSQLRPQLSQDIDRQTKL
jgi:hypothetical protein